VFHFYYVRHFDPRGFAELSARSQRPKVQRPLPREALGRALAGFGAEVARYVWYDSNWNPEAGATTASSPETRR
jgi:hypothetical protein